MAEKLFSVRIDSTGRYVRHCDDCWYETEGVELRLFTRERAEEIRRQLRNHYVYRVTISNGEETLATESPMKRTSGSVGENPICSGETGWGESIEW